MNLHNPKLIRNIVIGSGFAMSAISIIATISFWASLGDGAGSSGLYVATGLVISIIALIMLPISVYAWRRDNVITSVFSAFVWVVLVGLMLTAEFGFFSKSQDNLESQRNVAGLPYQAAKARLDSANERLASMSSNASVDIAGLSAKRDKLVSQKTALSVELSQCTKNHFKNCIKPKNAEIAAISAEIAGLDSQLGNGQGYKGALAEREAALKDLQSSAKAGGLESNMSPVFINGERLTGVPARQLQVYLMIILAFVMELWGSFSAALLMSDILDSREQQYELKPVSESVPVRQQETSQQPVKAVFAPQPAVGYTPNFGYSMIPPKSAPKE